MKRDALLSEITSNLKKLSDSQLADVADYIEMLMGGQDDEVFDKEDDKYDDDLDFLNEDEEDGYYGEESDDGFY